MCLVIAPAGRYFWSHYEAQYFVRMEPSKIQDPAINRDKPSSPDDTFEIAPDVLNYIGDWEVDYSSGSVDPRALRHAGTIMAQRKWDIDIAVEPSSISMIFDVFPDFTDRYEISLSMMGKEAISLAEFIRLVQDKR